MECAIRQHESCPDMKRMDFYELSKENEKWEPTNMYWESIMGRIRYGL